MQWKIRIHTAMVLIETLWNVKRALTSFLVESRVSFNRNIVECKAVKFCVVDFSAVVLIETLWNVKVLHHSPDSSGSYRFNRNIVECKVFTVVNSSSSGRRF